MMFSGKDEVHLFRLITLRSAINLAKAGIKMSRYMSVWQVLKRDYNKTFNKRTADEALRFVDLLIEKQEALLKGEMQ